MMNIRWSSYLLVAVLASCGESTMNEVRSTSSASLGGSTGSTGTPSPTSSDSTVLKTLNTIESSTMKSNAPSGSAAVSFSLSELSINQGESKEVEVSLKGSQPEGQVTLETPSMTGLKIELLNTNGTPLSGSLKLDSQRIAKVKVRLSSEFTRTATTVTAPGSVAGNLNLNAMEGSTRLSGTLPVKVSNVAIFVMSGVTAVKDLPQRFEFPAGTIPIIANPPTTQVAKILHFGGGGAGMAAFRHQSTQGQMPANNGYCPLNSMATSTLVVVGGAVSDKCLPCPAEGAADLTGTFYNHQGETAQNARTIVCKRKM